jgi:threonine/homoserine/homoserine lactone efflux protein
MAHEIAQFISAFWIIFSFSFLVALTGAMSPGPLLTYTIIKSAKTHTRGYLMGLWIITGHAILEMAIIVSLLLGFSFVLQNIVVVRVIGIVGGLILVYLGVCIARDVYRGTIPTTFLDSPNQGNKDSDAFAGRGLENPILGGVLVSMSNPYWWVWWASIGFAFIVQFDISFRQWPNLLAFFLGHEAGDLAWYLCVSFLAFFGMRHLNRKIYYGVLICCAIFMILFGISLGISPFLKPKI